MAPPNPLLQDDSPRRAYNSTEYSQTQSTVTLLSKGIALTSNLLLGPGIVIEQAPVSPGSGQVPYAKLSVDPAIVTAAAQVAGLEERITALEALITSSGSRTLIKNPQGDVVIAAGQFAGNPTLKFYQNAAGVERPVVSLASGTLAADVANALGSEGLLQVTP